MIEQELDTAAEIVSRATRKAVEAAHKERIHLEIVNDLEQNDSSDYYDDVEAIAAGRIRHLTIQY